MRWWTFILGLCLVGSFSHRLLGGAGTQEMARRLAIMATEMEAAGSPFLNGLEAQRLGRELDQLLKASPPPAPGRVATLRYRYAVELLNSGATEAALEQFAQVEASQQRGEFQMTPEQTAAVRQMHSVAFLRLGEQENCLLNHTAASCLLPIQPEGVHRLPRGSRQAVERLRLDLGRQPDLANRWLLNLAYMTLGEYPDRVPAEWAIPPELFASPIPLAPFPDIAGGLGLDLNDLAGGVVAEDFDRDGFTDLMISAWGLRDPLRLFRNQGDGTFRERSQEAGLTGVVSGLNLVQADYDNDGWVDVLVLRGAWWGERGRIPNSLLRNQGDGTFEDVTLSAGLYSLHPTQAAVWVDYNGDGWIDLFIGNESSPSQSHPCELYRNNGDGTFTEVARESGLTALGLIKAVSSADYNADGLPDLYVSCRGQTNVLYRNDGPAAGAGPAPTSGITRGSADRRIWTFSNQATPAGVSEPLFSFPAWFFDYDQDGRPDLFVGGYGVKDVGRVAADYLGLAHASERDRLYRNRGDGTFEDISRATGVYRTTLPMAGNFGDFDNDGWPDYYLGTGNPDFSMLIPNRAFRNDRGRGFQEVTTALRVGHLQKGHAISFADFDNDGDQDVYASIGGAFTGDFYRNVFFQNPGSTNAWIKLRLQGVRANRDGIGAHLKVTVTTPEGSRVIHKDVNSGGSFGANPLRQEIGLGNATAVESLEITWPGSRQVQRVTGLTLNSGYEVIEGQTEARRLVLSPVTWKLQPVVHPVPREP